MSRLVTWGVTNWDVLVLATIRYLFLLMTPHISGHINTMNNYEQNSPSIQILTNVSKSRPVVSLKIYDQGDQSGTNACDPSPCQHLCPVYCMAKIGCKSYILWSTWIIDVGMPQSQIIYPESFRENLPNISRFLIKTLRKCIKLWRIVLNWR